jgi:hypothetical protein
VPLAGVGRRKPRGDGDHPFMVAGGIVADTELIV